MKWEGNRESDNVEDRRGEDSGGGGGGGGFGSGSLGIGSIAIALVASYFLGVNPLTILSMLSGGGGPAPVVQHQPSNNNAPPANTPEPINARTPMSVPSVSTKPQAPSPFSLASRNNLIEQSSCSVTKR